jgi:6-phosphogluconate dehydrogenase
MSQADLGMIGLAVMGENLILNAESRGFQCAVFNRTTDKVDQFVNGRAEGKKIIGCGSIEEFCNTLSKPRKIMMMVKAGTAVDSLIEQLLPHLDPGDILIDGGNSNFSDTNRRVRDLQEKGFYFVGSGVSGGEEGALNGPSIMPGGSPEAWPHVKDIFQKMAAKVDDGTPCCDWVGEEGSGHFVKMVHNGIEYGDMQMICEAYHLLKAGLDMTNEQLHEIFRKWNETELNSYLIEITRDILAFRDENGDYVIDLILDSAGQKGTGKWTAINALDLGQPLTLIGEAVFARCLSSLKDERVNASRQVRGITETCNADPDNMVEDLKKALYASKIVSYAQGYELMQAAAKEYGWHLNYGGIALMWRGGCIIRSTFLGKIKEAYDNNPELVNLLLDPYFRNVIEDAQPAWRRIISMSVNLGIPMPAMGAALSYMDGYRTARLPANLLQAQRDYFGAHTYERLDKPRGEFFHTNWTGRGGTTSSSSYNA